MAHLSAQPAAEPIVELPVYADADVRDLPPAAQWIYGSFDGFEVLSNASDRATRALVHDLQKYRQAVGIVWPEVQRPSAVPAALIVCGRDDTFAAFGPGGEAPTGRTMTSRSLRDREQSAFVIAAGATPTDPVDAGNHATEADQPLHRAYLHFLLADSKPLPPAWLTEGLVQTFPMKTAGERSQAAGQVGGAKAAPAGTASTTVSGFAGAAPQENRAVADAPPESEPPPLDRMFAIANDSPEARQPDGSAWAAQCGAFVRWGLFSHNGAYQRAFLVFVARLSREPPTESLFRECFRRGYGDVASELRDGGDLAANQSVGFRARDGQKIPEPSAVEWRAATAAEVGRIEGDALRLAGHNLEARRAMLAPYVRGERDPPLLAALGLLERARGDDARARKFLEAAAQARVVRPRVYLELGRLRYAAALAQPAAAGGKLDATQAAAVLTPLFATRSQPPPLQEVYELIGETWAHCALSPAPGHLGALDEGVHLFPRDAALIYQDAALKAKIGMTNEAAALIDLGMRVAPDAAMRDKFEALKARLPRLAPPPPAPAPTSGG